MFFFGLPRKPEAYPRGRRDRLRDEPWREDLHEAVVRADDERALPPRKVECGHGGRENGIRLAGNLPDALAERRRVRGGHEPAPGANEGRVPVAARSRASVRLIADGLSPSVRAAPATLPAASRASSAVRRFRSALAIARGTIASDP